MCLSCADGGRRCRDPRRIRKLTMADLSPEIDEQHPEVDWAQNGAEDSLRSLWEQQPPPVVAEAVAVIAETREIERRTTDDVAASLPAGTRPHGLEFRMKSPASLARKIADRAMSGVVSHSAPQQLREISDKLTDILRYTALAVEHDELVPTLLATVESMQARGYRVVSAEHSYVAGNPYKGIHVLVQRDAERPVELQLHSELSQGVKDQNHPDYEVERRQDAPYRTRRQAAHRMVKRSAQVAPPEGLDALDEIGNCPLQVKRYPNRYGLADNEKEEVGSDG